MMQNFTTFKTYFAFLGKLVFIILTISCLSSSLALAQEENVLVKEKKERVSPFEKTNFFLQRSKAKLKGRDITTFTAGFEVPVYEQYLKYGFNFSFVTGTFAATDIGLLGRANLPISLWGAGDIGLTASAGFGLSSLFGADEKWNYKVFNPKTEEIESFKPFLRLGYFTSFSLGIEYYPIEWVGISIENHSKFYHYLKDLDKKSKRDPVHRKAFDLNIQNTTVLGLKITF